LLREGNGRRRAEAGGEPVFPVPASKKTPFPTEPPSVDLASIPFSN
jgi:hypothetical protein